MKENIFKTLVIHPDDRSTDFLKPIYEHLSATVVTGGKTPHAITELIKAHDKVMLMGHGSPHGLFTMGKFPGSIGYVINDDHADLLAEKKNTVYIWCNADQYVNYNKLSGFYTGMFISEVDEARTMGLKGVTYTDVKESNQWFVEAVSRVANDDTHAMHSFVKQDYGDLIHSNPVATYNHARLYVA